MSTSVVCAPVPVETEAVPIKKEDGAQVSLEELKSVDQQQQQHQHQQQSPPPQYQQPDHGSDNGEDSSESASTSRRESNSSADGNDDLDNNNNIDDHDHTTTTTTSTSSTLSLTDEVTKSLNTPPRRKRRKSKRKSRSKSHSRSVSRQLSSPFLDPSSFLHTHTHTHTHTATDDDPATVAAIAAAAAAQTDIENNANFNNGGLNGDLPLPPTRGRSNAFYGVKPVPVLVHSNSENINRPNNGNNNNSGPSSPRRNTMGYSSSNPVVNVPEPAHSGISRPKLFYQWKSFTVYDKAILSHSRRFMVGFAETIGRRPSMEDCMVIYGTFRGRAQEDYFAIFDGHGGRDSAAFAAEHLHQVLAEKLKTCNPVKSLKEAFADTHQMIAEQKIGGGTTAVVALFIGKKGFIANVGDTRAVLCRDGAPLRVSLDHKPELPTETQRIKKLGGTITTTYNSAGQATSRVNGMLAVSRALGDTPLHPYVSCEPEIHGPLNLDPQSLNQFVILACDGVWDVITDEEATGIVAPIANPEEASRRLRDEAFARGSTDNISVMVIRCPPFSPD